MKRIGITNDQGLPKKKKKERGGRKKEEKNINQKWLGTSPKMSAFFFFMLNGAVYTHEERR